MHKWRNALDRDPMRRTSEPNKYFHTVDSKEVNGQTLRLVQFNLPRMTRKARKDVLERIMEQDGADSLIEVISSRGGIVHKDQRRFYAILTNYRSKRG
jgi:hypothetical protein